MPGMWPLIRSQRSEHICSSRPGIEQTVASIRIGRSLVESSDRDGYAPFDDATGTFMAFDC